MNKLKKLETNLQGIYIIEPLVFEDSRGFFLESYNCLLYTSDAADEL